MIPKRYLAQTLGILTMTPALSFAISHTDTCGVSSNGSYSNYNQSCCKKTCERNNNEFSFEVEGLAWTTSQQDLDYAVDYDPDNQEFYILGKGDTHLLRYNWKTGIRGKIGYSCCGWETNLVYTYFKNNASDSLNYEDKTPALLLKASLLHPATAGVNALKASADSDFEYQTADLLFGREIVLCGRSFGFRPYFGLRGLKLKQNLTALYKGEDFELGEGEEAPSSVKWNSDIDAGGLHVGMESIYKWYCGLGFYSSFGGSILATRTDVRHLQQTLDTDGNVQSVEINLKENEKITLPGYHVTAGFVWDSRWFNCVDFKLKFGYEFNQWFNVPGLRRYHSENDGVSHASTSGALGLHGATLSTTFSF